MKQLSTILLSIALVTATMAQTLQFGGYFEHQLFPQWQSGSWKVQDYNKLRIDLSTEISQYMTFNTDYVFQLYHGQKMLSGLDYIPQSVIDRSVLAFLPEATVKSIMQIELKDRTYLDNAYLSLYFDRLSLTVGKQQIALGSGYAWNPIDILNIKNQLDPTYEKEGVNAVVSNYRFSSEGVVSTILSLTENQPEPVLGLKIKDHFSGFDVSIIAIQKTETFFDINSQNQAESKRRLYGADFSGQLLDLGVWAEGAFNEIERGSDYSQIVAGTDYTLENGLYLMTEYYFNGLGKKSSADYDISDWMRLLGSAGENLGRHYTYSGIMYPIYELWNASNYFIFNLSDGSGMILPWLEYNMNDNTQLSIIGYIPFGEAESEFGGFGGGGILRLRAYF